ncbi:hypothetical protein SNR37_004015 [Agarivorans aestuarii]|uniref:Uncharacterized protein n=1 Tax=Agarivorans aestuarii TaxID=1563703 RepID=A0ABU7G589_9ALTE|nr:hypothetical protein [Agarivorans aestuarii]
MSVWNKVKQALAKFTVEQQRVWIISRHDSLSHQDIYPLSEADLVAKNWQQRGFSKRHINQIEELKRGALIEVPQHSHRVTITRVK